MVSVPLVTVTRPAVWEMPPRLSVPPLPTVIAPVEDRLAAPERSSVPPWTSVGPVKVLATESVRVLPPTLARPRAPCAVLAIATA